MEAYKSKYSGQQIDSLLDSVVHIVPNSARGYELYGFKKCIFDSNPFSRIYPIEDNQHFQPVGMDFRSNKFSYGDWENAFFMKIKPVMLNYDGTVAYELNPDNYAQKKDGTDSDVANTSFAGNAMVGIPTVWIKCYTIGVWEYYLFSNQQLDEDFHAYAHTDSDGNIIPYCYMPIYKGSLVNGKLRSISGLRPTSGTTAAQEMEYGAANNPTNYTIWSIAPKCDKMLINLLCKLIGCSSNTQKIFGYGHCDGGNSASSFMNTGTMNDKGLFWGTQSNDGVKVFGMEHFWGERWDRELGSVYVNGTLKVKMTYGQQDGSFINGYNLTGDGYITFSDSTISGTSGQLIVETYANQYGEFPKTLGNTDYQTYNCEACWYNNSGIMVELHGGDCSDGAHCGSGCVALNGAASASNWDIGGSPHCKPKAS